LRAQITAGNASATSLPTTVPPDVRLRAQRHGACATAVGKSRSTPESARFMTSAGPTLTSTTGEVKLYLAVPSPPPSASLSPVSPPPSSQAASLVRRRFLARLVLGQVRHVWKS